MPLSYVWIEKGGNGYVCNNNPEGRLIGLEESSVYPSNLNTDPVFSPKGFL
jgi:hypothetical protein